MRFVLLDRITQLEPGKSITAVKNLTLAEEYLADHFPGFPVMPGVLMLEAMTQAAAWLIRASDDFTHSVVTLKEIRTLKYGNFVEPGMTLTVSAEVAGSDLSDPTLRDIKFKAQGAVDDRSTVSARLVLQRYNLATEVPDRAIADQVIVGRMRELFAQMYKPQSAPVPQP